MARCRSSALKVSSAWRPATSMPTTSPSSSSGSAIHERCGGAPTSGNGAPSASESGTATATCSSRARLTRGSSVSSAPANTDGSAPRTAAIRSPAPGSDTASTAKSVGTTRSSCFSTSSSASSERTGRWIASSASRSSSALTLRSRSLSTVKVGSRKRRSRAIASRSSVHHLEPLGLRPVGEPALDLAQ